MNHFSGSFIGILIFMELTSTAGVSVTAGLCSRVDPSMPKVSENEMISDPKN